MARLSDDIYPMPDLTWDTKTKFEDTPHGQEMNRLIAISDALPDGQIVGGVLGWGRGDGTAYYLVTSARPLTLQWIPFMDCWQVEDALIKGLTKADIKDILFRNKKIKEMFSASKETT